MYRGGGGRSPLTEAAEGPIKRPKASSNGGGDMLRRGLCLLQWSLDLGMVDEVVVYVVVCCVLCDAKKKKNHGLPMRTSTGTVE